MLPDYLAPTVFEFVRSRNAMGSGCQTGVENLFAFGSQRKTECSAGFYEPVMCLVLQGAKEAYMGAQTVRYSAGDTLIVSHAVPVSSSIIRASSDQPYVALALKLDLGLARSLYNEVEGDTGTLDTQQAMNAASSDAPLIDAVARLFELSKDPIEAKALAPLITREIHFRLLRARHGGMLRQLLLLDSPASRITKSIAYLRENFRSSIRVAELATDAGMSLSAFHDHFKSVTATTPLQYQKELRLLEAQRLLSTGGTSVASAAYDVGYESPTQFSREYTRKFGFSPSDQKSLTLMAG